MESPFWSVCEVASFFNVSDRTVYDWLKENKLPGAFKISRSWFIDRDVLMEECRKKASILHLEKGGDNEH